MVQTVSKPTGEFEPAQRSKGRSFYNESNLYYVLNAELMPQQFGIVGQIMEEHKTDTLLFDARYNGDKYVWQHTCANGENGCGGRVLTELSVNKNFEVQGWQATFDYSGRLIETRSLEEWETAWQNISAILRHNATHAKAAEITAALVKHEQSLARFILYPKISYTRRVYPEHFQGNLDTATIDEMSGLVEIETVKILQGAELDAEIERRERAKLKIGYAAVSPQLRPATPKPVHYTYQPALSGKLFSNF